MTNRFLTASAAALLSLSLVGAAGAVTAPNSPSATNAQFDSSSVQVRDMGQRAARGAGAPAVGVSPSAPASRHNATTVGVDEANAATTGRIAPRVGVSPSAPSYLQDTSAVR
jgi:hypothetical protein